MKALLTRITVSTLAAAATVCFAVYVIRDPWNIRDGLFIADLVDAYPYFLLTPTLALAALYSGWHYRRIRRWMIGLLVVFGMLKESRDFVWQMDHLLIPIAYQRNRVALLASTTSLFISLLLLAVSSCRRTRGLRKPDGRADS